MAKVRSVGNTVDVPMNWTGERNGEYRATFTAADRRACMRADVEATREGKPLGAGGIHIRATPGDAEYFDADDARGTAEADRRRDRRQVLHAETLAGLPEDLKYAGRGVTTVEERDLWHMPIVLLRSSGSWLREWAYRRAVGMA